MRKLLSLGVWVCGSVGVTALTPQTSHTPTLPLVVLNRRSADSVAIGQYYAEKRHIPADHVCRIDCPTGDDISLQEYLLRIRGPVREQIDRLKQGVDYVVLTKGIPIRTKEGDEGGYAVDSLLTELDSADPPKHAGNPYFARSVHFSHSLFHIYLVTRLDGYTRQDCLRLVDNSLAAKPAKGPFLFHLGPGHTEPGYKWVNDGMRLAHAALKKKGFESILSESEEFASGKGLMGYFSWGSNDFKFKMEAYHALTFKPGALADTAVSTSGRTFAYRDPANQSQIPDLIAQGVTGCKGYVSEPKTTAIAVPALLFDRYTSGFNLAESFYAASRYIGWKDIVIGDPLCRPYTP